MLQLLRPLRKLAPRMALMGVVCALATGCLGPRVQRPDSDVPVVANIGPWTYQRDLHIDGLDVTVIDARLNVMNDQALVRYRVTGSMSGRPGWHPYIAKVQVSQRLVAGATTRPYGDFQVTPVVSIYQDKGYEGGPVRFGVKVEQIIETLDWGKNRYVVTAGDQQTEFVLHQRK